ncbi:hypothetical protein DFAR_3920002 [Desulfarculales bacterium]
MRLKDMEAEAKSVPEIKKAEDLKDYNTYAFDSATYHGEMTESMKQLPFLIEKTDLSGKCGRTFGGFGWSGEGSERVYTTSIFPR